MKPGLEEAALLLVPWRGPPLVLAIGFVRGRNNFTTMKQKAMEQSNWSCLSSARNRGNARQPRFEKSSYGNPQTWGLSPWF